MGLAVLVANPTTLSCSNLGLLHTYVTRNACHSSVIFASHWIPMHKCYTYVTTYVVKYCSWNITWTRLTDKSSMYLPSLCLHCYYCQKANICSLHNQLHLATASFIMDTM